MRKNILFLVLTFTVILGTKAQEGSSTDGQPRFGIKAGYTSLTLKVSAEGTSASENISGFYIGGFAEFNLSDKFLFQPELHYASYSEDGESSDVLIIPLMAKYKTDEKFSLLAGPQFDYLLNKEDSEGLNRIGLGLAIGAAYDITEQFILDVRYSFGLSNRLDEDLDDFGGFDIKSKFDYFQVGLGYRF